jgi:hypothetical protein
MAAPTIRILHTTREAWSKEMSDETIEHHPLLKLMQSKNRIQYGCTGTGLKWTVKYKQIDMVPYADMDTLDFVRNQTTKTAELPWRGYKISDALSELEELMNQGGDDTQIIALFAEKLEQLKEDASDQLGVEFYRDGNATGNEKRFHGIESFMQLSGVSSDASQFATTISDSYAGLTTTEGTYGGTSSADREYDFWTPIVVNSKYNAETWATAAVKQLRRAIDKTKRGVGRESQLDLFLTSRSDFGLLKDQLDDKQRQVIPSTGLAKFGFPDMISVDGVEVTFDPDMPTTATNGDATTHTVNAYGFNTSKMKLKLLGKKKMLWNASGDTFREENMTKRFWAGLWGNLEFKGPRHFAKIAAIS